MLHTVAKFVYRSKYCRCEFCGFHNVVEVFIFIVKSTRCTNFRVYWISLYMFRTVFPSIIRSPRLYTQRQVYVILVCWLLASKQSTNLCDIYWRCLGQSRTTDDGRKDCLKHVEWYSINSKNSVFSWVYYRNTSRISRRTVPWTS